MVDVYRCPDLEPLVELLAARLRLPPKDPFTEEVILVPSEDMANFLRNQLAQQLGHQGQLNGIAANIRFVYPRHLVNASPQHPLGTSNSPWDEARLTWSIATVVRSGHVPNLPPAFLNSPLVASRRTAELFDRYASHRPEMLVGWSRGLAYEIESGGIHQWQADLYRAVFTNLQDHTTAARGFDDFGAFSASLTQPDLPQRISVFGVDSLTRAASSVLTRLGTVCDVAVFWVYPLSRSVAPVTALSPRNDATQSEITHPLASRWAAFAHESMALVASSATLVEPVPRTSSLLHQIQDGIIRDSPPPSRGLSDSDLPIRLAQGDGSLQVHACFGLARQAEALRDALLHLLNQDASLRLRDILVLCSDTTTVAPVLNAILNPKEAISPSVPRLSITVSGGSGTRLDEACEALDAVIGLTEGRCSAEQILETLALPPLQRKFGFDGESLDVIKNWTELLGIRFGLNAESRARWSVPEDVDNGTWRSALDRLFMGIAVPAEIDVEGPGGIVPFDGIRLDEVAVAGQLAEFIGRVETLSERLLVGDGSELTAGKWCDALQWAVDNFIDIPRRRAKSLIRLKRSIDRLRNDAKDAGALDLRFSVTDLRRVTHNYLNHASAGFWSPFESITVRNFSDLAHVPYRVIALIGAEESVFTAARSGGDDVLSLVPRIGEPIYPLRGRQNLFNMVMAARSHVIITCNGNDINSNKTVPLPVPVQELLETAAAVMADARTPLGDHKVLTAHPRHNFDDRTLTPGLAKERTVFTFDAASVVANRALRSDRAGVDQGITLRLLENDEQPSPTALNATSEILELLTDPISYYFEEVMEVDIPALPDGGANSRDRSISGDGILPVTLDPRAEAREGRRLLETIASSFDSGQTTWLESALSNWQRVRPLTELLPSGHFGTLAAEETAREVRAIFTPIPAHLHHLTGTEVDCEIPSNPSTRRLNIPGVNDSGTQLEFVRAQFVRFKPSMLLRIWAEVAALTFQTDGHPIVGYLASRAAEAGGPADVRRISMSGKSKVQRKKNAEKVLNAVALVCTVGAARPIPFFPFASKELAETPKSRRSSNGKIDDQLTLDAQRSSAIDWYLRGRSMSHLRDLTQPGSAAAHDLVAEVIGPKTQREVPEVDLLADLVWGTYHRTVLETAATVN